MSTMKTIAEKLAVAFAADAELMKQVTEEVIKLSDEENPALTLQDESGKKITLPLRVFLRLNVVYFSIFAAMTQDVDWETEEEKDFAQTVVSLTLVPVVNESTLAAVKALFHPTIYEGVKANILPEAMTADKALDAVQAATKGNNDEELLQDS